LRRLPREAREAGRGLWSACGDPAPPASSPPGAACDPNYAGACVPPFPPDADCADVGARVQVTGADPHGLDADGDGVGCESY
jgi:micrococcal nuclease